MRWTCSRYVKALVVFCDVKKVRSVSVLPWRLLEEYVVGGRRHVTGEDDRDLLEHLKRSTLRVSKRLGGVLTKEALDLLEVCKGFSSSL